MGAARDFYLTLWKTPRVRSSRAAEATVHLQIESFGVSEDLVTARRILEADANVEVDESTGRPPDQFLVLRVPRAYLPIIAPLLVQTSRELGLILFDPQHGILVVPKGARTRAWPMLEASNLDLLRHAVSGTPQTGDLNTDRRALAAGVAAAFELFELTSAGRARVPPEFAFAMPIDRSGTTISPNALNRIRKDLRNVAATVRRSAILELAGWQSPVTSNELERVFQEDSDDYTRALAMVALAARGHHGNEIMPVAEEIVENAAAVSIGLAPIIAAIAALAACIVARQDGSWTSTARGLVARVRSLPGEGRRAAALDAWIAG